MDGLPGAYAPACTALRVTGALKPPLDANATVLRTAAHTENLTIKNSVASELHRSSYRFLSAKLVQTFCGQRCRVASLKDPQGRILGFLDRSRYLLFQVVYPVPDPLLLRES
jgi:hypothetical protein